MVKILQISDVHIYNDKRHNEYRIQFDKLYELIKKEKIDIICIVGDLFESFIEISHEAKLLAGEFLNKLSETSHIVICLGNHDLRKKDLKRKNSIETIVNLINNPKITYFGESGFFQDKKFDNIIWTNWSHNQKHINPWIDIKHKRNKDKIYIDLFHDPIKGCSNEVGYRFDKNGLRNIKEFKGDISMMGDIHMRQELSKNKFFSGSYIQQNHGESILNHGGIIWVINSKEDIQHKFFDIPNKEFAYVTFKTEPNTNYNNLDLKPTEDISNIKNVFARVIWNDYSSADNKENENKIREYIFSNYRNVIKLSIERELIYTDIVESKMLSEKIDINDEEVQKSIIKEYLQLNKFDDDTITEILKIDEAINDRLNISRTGNVVWNMEKLWFSNFKSYGNYNEIDFNNINGVIQIHGANQQGKTTILDAICYVLYGMTLSTQKREKFGDNRFINNVNNSNSCDAGIIINVNGERYTIYRKTEKEVKNNTIKSCTTKLEYYKGEEMSEENLIVGENRIETQEMLDSVLGSFQDFIRLTLTNADNLNQLLSMDRAEFVDSITRDAGFNIFEIKLEEFKDYKKELNLEKINLNPTEEGDRIKTLNLQILDYTNQLTEIDGFIENLEFNKKEKQKEKDSLSSKLHRIEEIGENPIEIKEKIENLQESMISNDSMIGKYRTDILSLPENFDYVYYEKLSKKFIEVNDEFNTKSLKLKDLQNDINGFDNQISTLNQKILSIKQSEQSSLESHLLRSEYELKSINEKILNSRTDRKKEIKNEIKEVGFEIRNLTKEILTIKEEGVKVKKDIDLYKSSNDVCPTCERKLLTDEDFAHVNNKIANKFKDLKSYFDKGKEKMSLLKEKEDKMILLENKLSEIAGGTYNYDELKEIIDNLEEKKKKFSKGIIEIKDKIMELQSVVYENDEIKDINSKKFTIIEKSKDLKIEFEELEKEISNLLDKKKKIYDRLQQLDITKSDFEKKKDLLTLSEKLVLENKNIELEKSSLESNLSKYEKNLKLMEENEKIKSDMKIIDDLISEIDIKIKKLIDEKISVNNNLTLNSRILEEVKEKLSKYEKLQRLEYLHNTYINIMHRNGIPTFLLKKSLHIINKELLNLLSNVDFNLRFDEELNLKISFKDRMDISQNALDSSGKERTFASCALKLALRNVNMNSRPNFMFFDEVMTRLVENSVEEFFGFLSKAKEKLDKIIIIEHIHPIDYDVMIEVEKNSEGISSLTIL